MVREYEISVLIVTYNPDKEKLVYTINSVLVQENVLVEIVIADDGSKEDHLEEIREYLEKRKFKNYKICKNGKNEGTVRNIDSGLKVCEGQYIKLISPGDLLYGKECLKNWLLFLKENQVEMSFGDVIYYHINNYKIEPVIHLALPQDPSVYEKDDRHIRDNYLLLNDTIHGVSIICSTEILKKYIKMAVGTVIYAEDCIYRVMIRDGVKICHYSKDVILYEFGEGISTNGSNIWKNLIRKDLQATDMLILRGDDGDRFYHKFRMAIDARDNKCLVYKVKKYTAMPYLLIRKIWMKLNRRYTNTVISELYINSIIKQKE